MKTAEVRTIAASRVLLCAAVLALVQGIAAAADFTPGALAPGDANTPTRASHAPDDLSVSAAIRRALLADQSLSTSAKHIQISTNSEAVVLRGAVEPQEPDAIENMVKQYSGVRQIINQLTIADLPPQSIGVER